MDNSKIVFLINEDVRLISVAYDQKDSTTPAVEKVYQFKTLDPTIRVDDYVVVETGTRHGLTVCKVTAVDLDVNFDDGIPLKWAFQRVDMEAIEKIRNAESEAITAAARAELKRKRAQLREGIFAEHAEILQGLELTTKSLPAE